MRGGRRNRKATEGSNLPLSDKRTRSCMQPLRTPLNKLAGTRLASGGVIVVASPLTSLTGSPGAAADGGDSGRPQQGLCGFLAAGQASH
jgi:hypothetical protein